MTTTRTATRQEAPAMNVLDTDNPSGIFEDFTAWDAWLGFGYLGGRRNALDSTDPEAPAQPARVARADELVVLHARNAGWTLEDLFAWANSKAGRWTADSLFGTDQDLELAFAGCLNADLLVVPVD